jgi:4-amino-4-deoxy-L-arabinose transferase-like glycosyltransferase
MFGALLFRLAVVPALHSDGYTGDEREYISLGLSLAAGNEFIDSNGERSTRAPAFPYLLAGLFGLAGHGLLLPHVLGCVLGTAAIGIGYVLCRTLFAKPQTATIAAVTMSLYPGLVIYSALLQTESLFIVLLLLMILAGYRLLEKPTLMLGVLIGVLAGIAALTKAVGLGVFAVFLLSLLWLGRARIRMLLWPSLISFVAFCLVILPWTVRNYEVHGVIVPISLWGGQSLLLGNNPYSTGTWSVQPGFDDWFENELRARGIGSRGRLSELQVSRASSQIAIDYIVSHPLETTNSFAKKAHIFFIYPVTNSDTNIPLQAVAVGADVLLLLGVILGVMASWDQRGNLLPLLTLIGFFFLVHVLLHAEARYRLPVVPFLCFLFGVGLTTLMNKEERAIFLSRRRWQAGIVLSSLVFLVYSLTAWMFLSKRI